MKAPAKQSSAPTPPAKASGPANGQYAAELVASVAAAWPELSPSQLAAALEAAGARA